MQTDRAKLAKLLERFSHAMLTTRRGDRLRSRPMAICARHEELENDPNANVSMQDGWRFVSISATVHLSRAPGKH